MCSPQMRRNRSESLAHSACVRGVSTLAGKSWSLTDFTWSFTMNARNDEFAALASMSPFASKTKRRAIGPTYRSAVPPYISELPVEVSPERLGRAAEIGALLARFVLFMFSRLVEKPIEQLTATVENLDAGNGRLDVADVSGSAEIQVLADRFKDMALRLQASYGSLEAKIEERTAELEALVAQLDEANRLLAEKGRYQSDVLANVSHDLRTPLTSILGFAEVLERSSLGMGEPEASAVSEIKSCSHVLLNMVNNILDAARFDAGKVVVRAEPVDMVDVVASLREPIGALAAKKEISVSYSIDDSVPIMVSDWEKIRRICENLLSNAVKFTDEGGRVGLAVAYDAPSRTVSIEVSDTGVGIDAAEHARIFERFHQVEPVGVNWRGGSGLGLSIVRAHAEVLGGKVSVMSGPGLGSTFKVDLPEKTQGVAEK